MPTWILRLCPCCGKEFSVKTCRLTTGRGKYCSKECSYKSMPSKTFEERFFELVGKKQTNGCIWWAGHIDKNSGYGHMRCQSPSKALVLAHRASYELMVGPIPDGLFVLHRCDINYPIGDKTNRKCINPTHLFLGTAADNSADMIAKDRHQKGSRNTMAKLTEAQVIEIRSRYNRGNGEALARKFGVSQPAISLIITGKNWPWLKEPLS